MNFRAPDRAISTEKTLFATLLFAASDTAFACLPKSGSVSASFDFEIMRSLRRTARAPFQLLELLLLLASERCLFRDPDMARTDFFKTFVH